MARKKKLPSGDIDSGISPESGRSSDQLDVPLVGGGATGGDINAFGYPGSVTGINVGEDTELLQRRGRLGPAPDPEAMVEEKQTPKEEYDPLMKSEY